MKGQDRTAAAAADRLVLVSGGTHVCAEISDAQSFEREHARNPKAEPSPLAELGAHAHGRSAHVEREEIRGSLRGLDPRRFVVCVRIFLARANTYMLRAPWPS